MKIAQVAPLYESVPPKLYGGYRTGGLLPDGRAHRQGHEVTLFASGDSTTKARLVASCARALRLDAAVRRNRWRIIISSSIRYSTEIEQFDIIHFHVGYLHFPLFTRQSVPHHNNGARPFR